MKKVILSTAESKFKSTNLSQVINFNGTGVVGVTADVYGQYPVGHNFPFALYIFNNTTPDANAHPIPAQGDGDSNRNGDEIYAKGIRLRMQLENNPDKHNNTWKFWLVEYNFDIQGHPCSPSSFFYQATGNNLMDSVQTDRWSATLLGTYRTRSRDVPTGARSDIFVNKWIPFRRKLCFKSDDSLVVAKGMKPHFSIVGVCYDTSNTTGGVALGNVRANATLYYGDP